MLRARKGKTKSQRPSAPTVRKATVHTTVSAASNHKMRTGRLTCSSRKTRFPPQQEIDEQAAAHHSSNGAHRNLIGIADDATYDIARQHKRRAGHSYPRNGASCIIAHQHADHVW